MSNILIYRIEHTETKLGPFQHGKQEVINKGVSGSNKAYSDLDYETEVKRLLKRDKGLVKFGFNSWNNCRKAIIDLKKFKTYGFQVNVYKVLPEYISNDGQVLYIQNTFVKNKI
jgi:hypothetical protein